MTEDNDSPKTCEENGENAASNNEFSYLDRGGFSSEMFKIEVRDMPKFYGIGEFKKLLKGKFLLDVGKVKRPFIGRHRIYVCFHNEEQRTKALDFLDGFTWKGKTLKASKAEPTPDPLIRKRKMEKEEEDTEGKKVKEEKTQEEKMKEVTSPYADLPYEEQLRLKHEKVTHLMKRLDNQILRDNPGLYKYLSEKRKNSPDGISFEVVPIKGSPMINGYRNKCEFTVSHDEKGVATVGFRCGSYFKGDVSVAPVDGLLHLSQGMKNIVQLFQEFVRASPLPPYSPITYDGYWRLFTVRESISEKKFMLIVTVHPQDANEETLNELKTQLVNHFTGERGLALNVVSLFFQTMIKQKEKPVHLWGSPHITDKILGLTFRISPEAFFQVNTSGAEILYQSAMEMCDLNKESTAVIDVCCGTGTIGLCFAKHCHRVLGVDSVEEAIKDAKSNAELNGIDNCEFYSGLAEEKISAILERINTDEVVAVVDPPRAGLHTRALKILRNARKVKRIVYISCDPAAAMKNFIDFSRASSKTLKGLPLLPVKAVPVDMFPQTRHVELAILFERVAEGVEDFTIPLTDMVNNANNGSDDPIDFTADPV